MIRIESSGVFCYYENKYNTKGSGIMRFQHEKEFPFTMDTAWEALHKPASLDVSPGSEVTVISDTEWSGKTASSDGKVVTTTNYMASFDEEKKQVTIEGASDNKKGHDFIYLTLEEISEGSVKLIIEVEINTGAHFIAKAVGAIFAKPIEQIMCKHIYQNFEALCTGAETKRMSKEELDAHAKEFLS